MDVTRQIRTCHVRPNQCSKVIDQLRDSGIRYIGFGDELAIYSTDQASRAFLPGGSTQLDARFSEKV